MRTPIVICAFWFASPVVADDLRTTELMQVLAGHGCTLGEESVAAAHGAGFSFDEIRLISLSKQAEGTANAEGEFVVFDETICAIALPDIESPLAVDSPEIRTAAPYIREEFEYAGEVEVTEGCFLNDGAALFINLAGGDLDVGNSNYIKFLGANIVSGEARFFSTSPLETPLGFQITGGDCAQAPNVPSIADNQLYVEEAFGDWVRAVGAETPCGEDLSWRNLQIGVELQGADVDTLAEETTVYNAWLGFEFQLIAMSAGWFDGMSATERGTPRPPLCYYP